MTESRRRRKTRDEMIIEERYADPDDGPVESGFSFAFEEIEDPPRIMLTIIGRTSKEGMRIWFERDQFKAFVATALKVMQIVDVVEIFQGLIDVDNPNPVVDD